MISKDYLFKKDYHLKRIKILNEQLAKLSWWNFIEKSYLKRKIDFNKKCLKILNNIYNVNN